MCPAQKEDAWLRVILLACLALVLVCAGACGGPDIARMRRAGDIDGLVRALSNDTAIVRQAAAEALVDIGSAGAVDGLMTALDHPEAETRYLAIEALVRIGDPRAVEPVLSLLAVDPNNLPLDEAVRLRPAAISMLAEMGPDAVPPFARQLQSENAQLREVAVSVLTLMNADYASPVCDGEMLGSTAYDDGSAGPHPVIIAIDQSSATNWNQFTPEGWRALGESRAIELVLCWGEAEQVVVQVCNYAGVFEKIRRVREDRQVSLREAASGRVIESTLLKGSDPRPCPREATTRSLEHDLTGSVTPQLLIEWLRPFVEG